MSKSKIAISTATPMVIHDDEKKENIERTHLDQCEIAGDEFVEIRKTERC